MFNHFCCVVGVQVAVRYSGIPRKRLLENMLDTNLQSVRYQGLVNCYALLARPNKL